MKEDIIKMAREAGAHDNGWEVRFVEPKYLERFAAIVAGRCADIAHEAEPFHSADMIRKAFGVEK